MTLVTPDNETPCPGALATLSLTSILSRKRKKVRVFHSKLMRNTRHFARCRVVSGFTLIELVITVAIVAILATAALPVMELSVQRNKEQELRVALMQIRSAIDAYKKAADEGRIAKAADASGYPKSLEVLVDGADDIRSPVKKKIYFLRRLPRDPMSREPNAYPADTWGKRCYASSADNPQEGNDVYDVYSRSAAAGLNRIPYNEW